MKKQNRVGRAVKLSIQPGLGAFYGIACSQTVWFVLMPAWQKLTAVSDFVDGAVEDGD